MIGPLRERNQVWHLDVPGFYFCKRKCFETSKTWITPGPVKMSSWSHKRELISVHRLLYIYCRLTKMRAVISEIYAYKSQCREILIGIILNLFLVFGDIVNFSDVIFPLKFSKESIHSLIIYFVQAIMPSQEERCKQATRSKHQTVGLQRLSAFVISICMLRNTVKQESSHPT